MKIDCSYDELVDTDKVNPHPQNPNKHPDDQIERLAKVIEYQGQRSPLVICKDTNLLIVGHGRLEAIKRLGWEKVAVDFQKFDDDAQRYAHMTADNALRSWSDLDLSQINEDFLDFGPELDMDMLGIKDFTMNLSDKKKDSEVALMFDYKLEVDCGDEKTQQKTMEDLVDKGFKVRVLL